MMTLGSERRTTSDHRLGRGFLIMAAGINRALQRRIAKQTPGAVTVEAVDLTDVITFAGSSELDNPGDLETVWNSPRIS